MQELGEMIGRAMRAKETTSINVSEPNIHLDAKPIADAVSRSTESTALALTRSFDSSVQQFVRAFAEAIEDLPQAADNEGIEARLEAVTAAIKRNELMPAVQLIVTVLDKQASETAKAAQVNRDLVAAMRENTAAILADKTITDSEGRSLKMKVGK